MYRLKYARNQPIFCLPQWLWWAHFSNVYSTYLGCITLLNNVHNYYCGYYGYIKNFSWKQMRLKLRMILQNIFASLWITFAPIIYFGKRNCISFGSVRDDDNFSKGRRNVKRLGDCSPPCFGRLTLFQLGNRPYSNQGIGADYDHHKYMVVPTKNFDIPSPLFRFSSPSLPSIRNTFYVILHITYQES